MKKNNMAHRMTVSQQAENLGSTTAILMLNGEQQAITLSLEDFQEALPLEDAHLEVTLTIRGLSEEGIKSSVGRKRISSSVEKRQWYTICHAAEVATAKLLGVKDFDFYLRGTTASQVIKSLLEDALDGIYDALLSNLREEEELMGNELSNYIATSLERFEGSVLHSALPKEERKALVALVRKARHEGEFNRIFKSFKKGLKKNGHKVY